MRALKTLSASLVLAACSLPLLADTYTACTTQTVSTAFSQSCELETFWRFEDTVVEGNKGVKLVSVDPGIYQKNNIELPTIVTCEGKPLPVLEYGDGIFAGNPYVESVAIPNTVIRIGDNFFSNCTALTSVSLGSNLRSIGKRPFVNTNVRSITLPDTLLSMDGNIAAGTPYGSKITISDSSHFCWDADGVLLLNKDKTRLYACMTRAEGTVLIPNTVKEIIPDVFFGCFRLQSLSIPASVTKIGSGAFNVQGIWDPKTAPESTPHLETIFYLGDDPTLFSVADDIYTGTPDTLTSYAFSSSWKSLLPTWKGRALVVNEGAFSTDVLNADYLGVNWKFRLVSDDGSSYYAEIWNNGKAAIPTSTQASSTSTYAIYVPAALAGFPVNKIGEGAFAGCNVCSMIVLPSTVSTIDDRAFAGCTALSAICDDSVSSTGLSLPDGIETLGKRPFDGMNKVGSLTIPATLKEVNGNPIAGCNYITSIEVDENNRYFTFESPLLYSSDLETLYACLPTAKQITVPDTVTDIAEYAFENCDVLRKITFEGAIVSAVPATLFDGLPKLTVSVDINTMDEWESVTNNAPWKALVESGRFKITGTPSSGGDAERSVTDTSGITWYYRIQNGRATVTGMDAGDTETYEFTIPEKLGGCYVAKIADYAFYENWAIDAITLPSRCLELGKTPFYGTFLTELTLPKSLKTIDGNPLEGCDYLESLTVEPGNCAFTTDDKNQCLYDCEETTLLACVPTATEITLPATLTTIAKDAFAGCSALETITALCDEPDADDTIFNDTPTALVVQADANALDWGDPCPLVWKGRTFENTGVAIPEGLQYYTDDNKVEWTYTVAKDQTIEIGTSECAIPISTSGKVSIPETIPVDGLGDLAVVKIGAKAFADCADVTSITIPANVTSIQAGAFNGCTNLESFSVAAANASYRSSVTTGVLYSKDGKTLVKVPATFRFKTVYNVTKTTTDAEVDEHHLIMSNVVYTVTNKTAVTSTTHSTRTSIPDFNVSVLFTGVEVIADYAFCDCGFAADEAPTSECTSNVRAAVYYLDPEQHHGVIPKTVTIVTTTSTTEVPFPEIPSTVAYSQKSFAGSVWDGQITATTLPALSTDPSLAEISTALASVSDARVAANITTAEDYADFRTWAMSVRNASGQLAGNDAVMNSPATWTAFALDLAELPVAAPTSDDVKVKEYSAISGTSTLRLLIAIDDIKIGSKATAERLKTIFGISGSSTLTPSDFSSDKVDLVFGTPVDGMVPVTAEPADSTTTSFFIKVGLK